MTYDAGFLDGLLSRYGPIWAAGYWYGAAHIIVTTGVDPNGTVYVNDPDPPARKVHDMAWFNEKVAKEVPYPMMYLP
jgi:hypothetical protein